jgi:hypothetical protein
LSLRSLKQYLMLDLGYWALLRRQEEGRESRFERAARDLTVTPSQFGNGTMSADATRAVVMGIVDIAARLQARGMFNR